MGVRVWLSGLVGVTLLAQAPAPTTASALALPRLPKAPALTPTEDLSGWEGALRIGDFWNWYPMDQGRPSMETVAYLAWGPDGLYVAVAAYDPDPASVRAFPSRRDNLTGSQDYVCVDLDATGKGQTAVSLTCNAFGNQADLLGIEGGNGSSYDLLWDSVGLRTAYGYLVKIRVPYTSLRRLPGEWGIRISRFKGNGRGLTFVWPQQSQDRNCDLCQLARISGAPIATEGDPFLVIPTLTARRTQSSSAGVMGKPESEVRPGLDLRYSGRALTVDGTYRPDFSAVEADVDPLIINSRYKYQYPEKRPFFQEGLEVFSVTGAQQQFASRSLVDPKYGVKLTGRQGWGTWGLLQVQDQAGGTSIATDGSFLTEGLQTRNLAAATRIDTDGMGSNLTLMGTDALLLGGGARAYGRSGGAYLDQHVGEHFKAGLSRIESWTRLPTTETPVRADHGSATAWSLNWTERRWWAGLSGAATSPDLILANGFVDVTPDQANKGLSAGAGLNYRSDKAWWSYVGGGINLGRSDYWAGGAMSRSGSVYGNLSTRFRLNFFVNLNLRGREWVLGRVMDTRSLYLNANFTLFAPLRPSLTWSRGRTPDYDTGLPAWQEARSLNLAGNLGALSYSIQGGDSCLWDEASGALLKKARRLYAKVEYCFPHDLYLRLQSQITRREVLGTTTLTTRYGQLLAGWQPNAFSQVYVGYAQTRKTDVDMAPALEHLMEKGLFAKASYAIRF